MPTNPFIVRSIFFLLLLAFFSCWFSACSVRALISPGNADILRTDTGYDCIDTFKLGTLFIVDTTHQVAFEWETVRYDSTDTVQPQPPGKMLITPIKAGLEVIVSGHAGDTVKKKLADTIKNELFFRVSANQEQRFKDFNQLLKKSANDSILKQCKDTSLKGQLILAVVAVIRGSYSNIYLNNDSVHGVAAATQKIGGRSVAVTYGYSRKFEKTGKDEWILFEPQFYRCDPDSGLVRRSMPGIDLSEYNIQKTVLKP